MTDIEANLRRIREQIETAARKAGRDPGEVRLLAVSKTFGAERVEEVVRLGQTLFGENRIQEAQTKIPAVNRPGLEWHLIGHLQSNKVRQAVGLFDVIESVDTEKLARRLDHVCSEEDRTLQVLIQTNIGDEEQKSGVSADALLPLVRVVASLEHLDLRGLMAIPPFFEDPECTRPYFRRLFELRSRVEDRLGLRLPELSMGMSQDFPVAVEEGATIVRVGTALFGRRD